MPSAGQSGHSSASKVHCQVGKEADYNAKVNLTTKVLDFVQLGGPDLTVASTTFELVVPL